MLVTCKSLCKSVAENTFYMSAKTIMIQGTGSHVGKSIITAALCRIFLQDGYRVAPFKSQNMALNSFVTEDGGEMGRAQVVQAEACRLKPTVDMNPILIKPTANTVAQVIVKGKPVGNMSVEEYIDFKKDAITIVKESLSKLVNEYDVVVIEGAGSPAEINLKSHDLVNMKIAELADAPVLLAGDIDKGGVFAWFVGTIELLSQDERERVKGFIINKFRGRRELLNSGIDFLEDKTGKKVVGVIPFFTDISIMEEDSVSLSRHSSFVIRHSSLINIDVILLPHISNFTDFDPFELESDVRLRYIRRFNEINSPDVIIIPGSKNTISDLQYLRSLGIYKKIKKCVADGTELIGICGGYQMLGKRIIDKDCIESGSSTEEGFGFLDMVTSFYPEKATYQVNAIHIDSGVEVSGYEIHMGKSERSQKSKQLPVFKIVRRGANKVELIDGLKTEDGNIWGTYMHGIFENDFFRRRFLDSIRIKKGSKPLNITTKYDREKEYNKLAEVVRNNIDMDEIYRIIFS